MADTETISLPPAWKQWLVGLAVGLAAFHAFSGQVVGPILNAFSSGPPRLMAVILDVNGRRLELMPGQGLVVRPLDNVRVAALRTNLWSKKGLTLEGVGFDARPLLTGTRTASLLPVERSPAAYEVVINRGVKTLGRFSLVTVMLPVDWVLLAASYDGAHRFQFLNRAMDQAGPNPILLDRIAAVAKSLGWTKEAVRALEAKQKLVFSPAELASLANMYQELGRFKSEAEAVKLLAKLEPANQSWPERLLAVAERAKDAGLKVEALKSLAKTASGPRSVEAVKKLGYTYVQAGRWREAAQAYQEAARLDPKDVNIFNNLAVIYAKLGDAAARRKALARVAALKPGDVEVLRELARTAPAGQALEAWGRVLKVNPDDREALVKSIKILAEAGPSPRLAELYTRLAALTPEEAVVHYNLGLTLLGLDRLEEAERSLDTAHQLAPHDADALIALLDVQRRLNKNEAAAATAEKLLPLTPKDINLYRLIYKVLSKSGDRRRLGKILERGVKANPDKAELWKLLALNRLAGQDLAGAAKALSKAVALAPDDIDNRLRLAKLLENTGQPKKALSQYEAILKRQPDHPVAGPAYLNLKLRLLKKRK